MHLKHTENLRTTYGEYKSGQTSGLDGLRKIIQSCFYIHIQAQLNFAPSSKNMCCYMTLTDVLSLNSRFTRDEDGARLLGYESKAYSSQADQPIQQHAEYISGQDLDTILSLSIHQLQKVGGRVPVDVQTKLKQWLENQHESNAQSLQHFMAFFEYWRAAQMSMAVESLHRYFDYSMGANRGLENLKVYFQYAQLHKSVLYADFECWEESVNAMSECIATGKHQSLLCTTQNVSGAFDSNREATIFAEVSYERFY